MPLPVVYHESLKSLERTREARKLAALSRQIMIEQFLLAEIMYDGNEQLGNDLDFYLEEQRRDLTIRLVRPGSGVGPLIEWVEAKMCWTDCLARELTQRREAMEYRDHMKDDAEKQNLGPACSRGWWRSPNLAAIRSSPREVDPPPEVLSGVQESRQS